MKKKIYLFTGLGFVLAFLVLMILLLFVDKANDETKIGLKSINNILLINNPSKIMDLVSDGILVLSFIYLGVMIVLGIIQLIKRKSLLKVDGNILSLGIGCVVILILYIFFDKVLIVNNAPLACGKIKPSFPSSHILVTVFLAVNMIFSAKKYLKNEIWTYVAIALAIVLSFVACVGRIASCNHWLTDVTASVLLAVGVELLVQYLGVIFNDKFNKNNVSND